MDPQLDVNALIQILRGAAEFVAFAQANRAAGLAYNAAAKAEFLANGLGTQAELDSLARGYGVALIGDVSDQEIDVTAGRLQAAFVGTVPGRVLRLPDARILATAYGKNERLATGDLQLFKRARDLGLAVVFLGSGRSAARASAYVPRSVTIPGSP